MHILIISEFFLNSERPYDGTFVWEQAIRLARRASVTIVHGVNDFPFLHRYDEFRININQIPLHEYREGIHIYRPRYRILPLVGKYFTPYLMLLRLYKNFFHNKRSIDIIHAHWAYRAGYLAACLGRLSKTKVVITAQGSDINIWADKQIGEFYLQRRRILSALNKADLVIPLSNDLATKISRFGVPTSRIRIIGQGIAAERFKPIDQLICRKKLGLPLDHKIILCVANLLPIKGLNYLLSAYSDVKKEFENSLLILVGDGPLRSELIGIAHKLGFEQNLRMVGNQPHQLIPLWMNAADLLVLPSLNEGFGAVVLESLACGTPVVATRVGGIPDALGPETNGILVDKGDSKALANAIIFGLKRKWNKEKLVEYARQFTWEFIADRLYQEYQSLLNSYG